MIKYRLAIGSAVLNVLGTLLLVFSFQATSSDFMLVTAKDGRAALCVGKAALFVLDQQGGLGVGTKCPDWQTGSPAAVVNTEHPNFVVVAFFLIVAGFVLQVFSINKPVSQQPHISANSPCPCGSGKKYKKCCGKPIKTI